MKIKNATQCWQCYKDKITTITLAYHNHCQLCQDCLTEAYLIMQWREEILMLESEPVILIEFLEEKGIIGEAERRRADLKRREADYNDGQGRAFTPTRLESLPINANTTNWGSQSLLDMPLHDNSVLADGQIVNVRPEPSHHDEE